MSKGKLALFDLDNTLLAGDSDDEWLHFLVERGVVDRAAESSAHADMVRRYRAGQAGAREFCEFFLRFYVPHDYATLLGWRDIYLRERILPLIADPARRLLESHRDCLVVIATATNRFLTEPIARTLGVEHLIATEPEIRDGRFTGRVAGTPSFGEGKATRTHEWLAARGQSLGDFAESWFFSDSINDAPLLECVSHPVAVDPDERLRKLALERNWQTISLRKTLPSRIAPC